MKNDELHSQVCPGGAKNGTVEIAGPEPGSMIKFVQRYLDRSDDSKVIIPSDDNKYMHFVIPKDLLVPLANYYTGDIDFQEWLKDH